MPRHTQATFSPPDARDDAVTWSRRFRTGRFASRTPGHTGGSDRLPGVPAAAAIDWNDLLPRQVVAVGGVFLAATAIVGMIVSGSPEAMPFALAGLAAAVGGFAAELAPRLREAIGNLLEDRRGTIGWQRVAGSGGLPQRPAARTAVAGHDGADPAPDAGMPLQGVVVREPPRRLWSPAAAAAMSVIPGLGHVYKGTPLVGLGWLAIVTAGYSAFVLPGLVLHGCCVLDSLAGTPWSEARVSVVRP